MVPFFYGHNGVPQYNNEKGLETITVSDPFLSYSIRLLRRRFNLFVDSSLEILLTQLSIQCLSTNEVPLDTENEVCQKQKEADDK